MRCHRRVGLRVELLSDVRVPGVPSRGHRRRIMVTDGPGFGAKRLAFAEPRSSGLATGSPIPVTFRVRDAQTDGNRDDNVRGQRLPLAHTRVSLTSSSGGSTGVMSELKNRRSVACQRARGRNPKGGPMLVAADK